MKIEKVFDVEILDGKLSWQPVGMAKEYEIYRNGVLWKKVPQATNIFPFSENLQPFGNSYGSIFNMDYLPDIFIDPTKKYSIGMFFMEDIDVLNVYGFTIEMITHPPSGYDYFTQLPIGGSIARATRSNYTAVTKCNVLKKSGQEDVVVTYDKIRYNGFNIGGQPAYAPSVLRGIQPIEMFFAERMEIEIVDTGDYTIKTIAQENTNREDSDLTEPVHFTGGIRVLFYNNNAENIVVNKTRYLVEWGEYLIFLKDSCSITNPELIMAFDKFPNFNYCYIPRFNRYYYVDSVTAIRTGVWSLSLSVDVLMSFKDTILQQDALIARNEFEWNDMLVDHGVKTEYAREIETVPIEGVLHNNLLRKFGDDVMYVIGLATSKVSLDVGVPSIGKKIYNVEGVNYYLLNYNSLDKLLVEIYKPSFKDSLMEIFQNRSETIVSLKVFPVSIWAESAYHYELIATPVDDVFVGSATINIGTFSDGYRTFRMKDGYMGRVCGNEVSSTEYYYVVEPIIFERKYNSFLDYAPYTKIEMNLPFVGIVDIDPEKVYGKELYLNYLIDLVTGKCTVTLSQTDIIYQQLQFENANQSKAIYIWNGVIGLDCPISGNNQAQIWQNLALLGVKTITGGAGALHSYSSNASMIQNTASYTKSKGISKKGALQLAQNNLDLVGSTINILGDTVSGLLANTPRSYATSVDGDLSSWVTSKQPIIRYYRIVPQYPEDYNHYVGRPLLETRTLEDVHGFTVVQDIHLRNFSSTLVEEKDEIEDLLLTGVILP